MIEKGKMESRKGKEIVRIEEAREKEMVGGIIYTKILAQICPAQAKYKQ